MRPSFFHHLHPPTIPEQQARFRYTLGAGGISVYLVLVLILTGILEMFYYIPTPEDAAISIQQLTYLVPFGGFVRNLHYWAAQLLVVTTLLHLLRVLLTGGYAPPRRFNYLLGLGLLLLVVLLDFSGYVLRWDEGIRWALVAGTNLLRTIPLIGAGLYRFVVGGVEPGAATVIRFYTWHIFGLTLMLTILGVWHLFRVRRDGGIAAPPPTIRTSRGRISRNELVRREVLAVLLVSLVLIVLAALLPAPIAAPIDDTVDPGLEARAPWFFLWVQALLRFGDPFLTGVLIPSLLLLILVVIPYILRKPSVEQLGRWLPPSGRAAQYLTAGVFILLVVLTIQALIVF